MRRSPVFPELPSIGDKASVRGVIKRFDARRPQVVALDDGGDWLRDEKDVINHRPLFRRTVQVDTNKKSAILGRRLVHQRKQVAKANATQPYRIGQHIKLTVQQDSAWKRRLVKVPTEEYDAGDHIGRATRLTAITAAGIFTVAGVVIGGSANTLTTEEITQTAAPLAKDMLDSQTGEEQFRTIFINGGDAGEFDDSFGHDWRHTGINRAYDEFRQAEITIGSTCLSGTEYDTGRLSGAAYKERENGTAYVQSRSGTRLNFGIDEGVLYPSDMDTVATLKSFHCEATGLPVTVAPDSDEDQTVIFNLKFPDLSL